MLAGERDSINPLEQLLHCTAQMTGCEEDPDMDIAAVASACRSHLLAVQRILSRQETIHGAPQTKAGGFSPADSEHLVDLKEMLQCLVHQTDQCMAALSRQLERTERELTSLRGNRKAIRAYHGQ